ncbi:MAG: hypothetical protein FJX47_10755 [Alphaproteobacteria bacterium]|nr:hypothetical protein [Alphaproteobacteria bacterium]
MSDRPDLSAEMRCAIRGLDLHLELGALGRLAIPPPVVERGLVGASRIVVDDGFFEPGHEGKWTALICPVADDDGTLLDLVAFDPARPACWWLRTGIGRFLGQVKGRWDEGRQFLHPTPLSWLQSGGLGAVVLARDADEAKTLLSDLKEEVTVRSPSFGARLEAVTTPRPSLNVAVEVAA